MQSRSAALALIYPEPLRGRLRVRPLGREQATPGDERATRGEVQTVHAVPNSAERPCRTAKHARSTVGTARPTRRVVPTTRADA